MPATTTRLALPYPVPTDPADIPADMQALANKLDPASAVFLQGTAATRPAAGVAGRFHYATDTSTLTYDNGTAWVGIGATAGVPPLVSSLPGTPVDTQEVYYLADATNGVIWHLRYRAASASTYKWEYLGGPALQGFVATTETTTSTVYVSLATPGPTVTAPLPGDYRVEHGCASYVTTPPNGAKMSYDVGATPAVSADDALSAGGSAAFSVGTVRKKTLTAATTTITAKYAAQASAAGTCGFLNRWLKATPIRVG